MSATTLADASPGGLDTTSVPAGWGLTVSEVTQLGTPAIAPDLAGLRDSVTAAGGVLAALSPGPFADGLAREMPSWASSDVLPVEVGRVLLWPTVVHELLDQAVHRVAARHQSAHRGEDVAVARRQVAAGLAAWCDCRAWLVGGISDLVAFALLLEVGAVTATQVVAAVLLVCLVLAVLGTWADAVRRTAIGTAAVGLACAYWAVPFSRDLASSTTVSAASRRNWRWAATRSTLANNFRLITPWDRADRAVSHYAADFHNFTLVLRCHVIPVVAFAGLGAAGWRARTRHDRQRLRLLVVATVLALLVVLLGIGISAPGPPLFGVLKALPCSWLLQDPGPFPFVAGAAYAVPGGVHLDEHLPSPLTLASTAAAKRQASVRVQAPRPLGPGGVGLVILIPAYPLLAEWVVIAHPASPPLARDALHAAAVDRPPDRDAPPQAVPLEGYRHSLGRKCHDRSPLSVPIEPSHTEQRSGND